MYIHTRRQASHTANEIRKQEDRLASMRRYLSIIGPRIREDGLINCGLRALGGFPTWLQDRGKLCTPVELMNLGKRWSTRESTGCKGFLVGEKERCRWTVREKGRSVEREREEGYRDKVTKSLGLTLPAGRVAPSKVKGYISDGGGIA